MTAFAGFEASKPSATAASRICRTWRSTCPTVPGARDCDHRPTAAATLLGRIAPTGWRPRAGRMCRSSRDRLPTRVVSADRSGECAAQCSSANSAKVIEARLASM